MMRNKGSVVFPRLLQAHQQNEEFLAPMGGLREVIALKPGNHVPVRVAWDKGEIK